MLNRPSGGVVEVGFHHYQLQASTIDHLSLLFTWILSWEGCGDFCHKGKIYQQLEVLRQ